MQRNNNKDWRTEGSYCWCKKSCKTAAKLGSWFHWFLYIRVGSLDFWTINSNKIIFNLINATLRPIAKSLVFVSFAGPTCFFLLKEMKPGGAITCHVSAGIDAVIMPVVSRNTIKRGNKRVVKLGDKEIVLNDPRLGMTLKIHCQHISCRKMVKFKCFREVWWQNLGMRFCINFQVFFVNYFDVGSHCQSCCDSRIGSVTLPLTFVVYTVIVFFCEEISWEPKGTSPVPPPPRKKALLRDY